MTNFVMETLALLLQNVFGRYNQQLCLLYHKHQTNEPYCVADYNGDVGNNDGDDDDGIL